MDDKKILTDKMRSGEVIIEEGTWAYYAYILRSGKARVIKIINGKQVKIGSFKKGDVFGEMAFLGGTQRIASVIADGDVEVEEVPGDVFMEALEKLSEKTRAEIKLIVSDLSALSEVLAQILSRAETINEIKKRSVEVKSLKKGISGMSKPLQRVVLGLVEKRNKATERFVRLAKEIEEATKPID